MKLFYSTERVFFSNNIEKPDVNKLCSVITMEDPGHGYRVEEKKHEQKWVGLLLLYNL